MGESGSSSRAPVTGDRVVDAAERGEVHGVLAVREGRSRVERQSPFERLRGARPVPVEPELDVADGDVRLGQGGVDRDRLLGGALGFRECLDPVRAQQQVGVGQPGVRERVVGSLPMARSKYSIARW